MMPAPPESPMPLPVNVLLVDDKPENLLALEAVLGDLELNLVTAHSGDAALGCLLRDDFAVILLDVYMPGMDGLETAALIRDRDRSRDTPIIFVTAAGRSDELIAQGYGRGAVDYIVKPINPDILRSKVSVFAELCRKREQVARQAAQLTGLNEELEARVAARTTQLERAVAGLQEQIVERERAEQEARDAVRIRDDFLSVASHELKTPITSLNAALQILQRATRRGSLADLAPERLQRMLEIIEQQGKRLVKLVDELLDVSRLSEGRLQLDLEQVDLAAVVREVVERFHEESALAGCALDVRCAESVVGVWDRSRLEQVVTNLLSNALKYGAGTAVSVHVDADATRARLVVADHGIGIAAERLPHIFGRFERAVSSKDYSGVGLGLYIVHEIVDTLGGTVDVTSAEGQGATFTVELPLHAAGVEQAPPLPATAGAMPAMEGSGLGEAPD